MSKYRRYIDDISTIFHRSGGQKKRRSIDDKSTISISPQKQSIRCADPTHSGPDGNLIQLVILLRSAQMMRTQLLCAAEREWIFSGRTVRVLQRTLREQKHTVLVLLLMNQQVDTGCAPRTNWSRPRALVVASTPHECGHHQCK